MALTVLLTDSDSPYGAAVCHRLEGKLLNTIMLREGDIDWQDEQAVTDCIAHHRPNVVVSTLLPVELDTPEVLSTYLRCCENLAKTCKAADVSCIHISSYRVYGDHNRVGDETDVPEANTHVAKILLNAESKIAEIPRHIILRFSWPIGPNSNNLLVQLLNHLVDYPKTFCDDTYVGTPTSFHEMARLVVAMVMQVAYGAENWGVLNYAPVDSCTEEEFARCLCELLDEANISHGEMAVASQGQKTFIPIGSALLDGHRCKANFGIQSRSWKHGLASAVAYWWELRNQQNTVDIEVDGSASL